MKKVIKKIKSAFVSQKLFAVVLFLILLAFPLKSYAFFNFENLGKKTQEIIKESRLGIKSGKGRVKAVGNVNVSATVPSEVSEPHSKIDLSATEMLADPQNHFIIITITLYDDSMNPLPDLWVEARTNRGEIDVCEPCCFCSEVMAEQDIKKCKTNAEGKAGFRISSYTPGEVTVYITADTLIEFDPIYIKFLPLPFPAQLTVSVPLPGTDKEIKLIEPKEEITKEMREAKRLANIGTEISIPFWLILTIAIFIILTPILLVWNLINVRRVRKMERRELEILKKISAHDDMESLRKEVRR